jgi:hypothetical protein
MAFSFNGAGGAFASATPGAGASAQTGNELPEIHTEVWYPRQGISQLSC